MASKHERTGLLSLPLELQIEILLYLDLNSVLALRQVCKALHTPTVQRPVWMNILVTPPPPMNLYSFFLNKDIGTCTGADIETIISDCFRQQRVWGNPAHFRWREVSKRSRRRGTILLVPGGRWMITFTDPGGALATDLWALEKPAVDLCPPADPPGSSDPFVIHATLPTQEAGFHTEFKMFIISEYIEASVECQAQVWLVRPTYDAAGQVDGLVSKLLSSFACGPLDRRRMCLSISGQYIGYLSSYDTRGEDLAVILIDWKKANGQGDFNKIPKYVLRDHQFYGNDLLSLLPNGTFLTNTVHGYELWEISSIAPVFYITDALPIWPISIGEGSMFSGKYAAVPITFDDGTVHISWMCSYKSICFSTISKEEIRASDAIFSFSVGAYTSIGMPTSLLLGVDKGIKFVPPDSAECVKFQHGMGGAQATLIECPHVHWQNFHMDSFSGTIVLGQSKAMETVIIDFPFR